jgi:hypothetical protein
LGTGTSSEFLPTHMRVVLAGIAIGMPAISILVVISHCSPLSCACASATGAPSARTANRASARPVRVVAGRFDSVMRLLLDGRVRGASGVPVRTRRREF